MQTVENPALRQKLQLEPGMGGLMITRPFETDASYPLKEWDVVTHIGEQPIDNQGNIPVGDELRLSFRYLIPQLARDGKVPLTIRRDGQACQVEVPTQTDTNLVIRHLAGEYPSYFLCGPLVFLSAAQEVMVGLGSRGQGVLTMLAIRQSPLVSRWFDRARFPGEQLVILGPRMIPSPLVEGYDNQVFGVVTHVNDVEIKNLVHLVETIRQADGQYITFKIGGSYETMVFQREELVDSTDRILEDEGIRYQMSDDLLPYWETR
jgi:hypothetical protein